MSEEPTAPNHSPGSRLGPWLLFLSLTLGMAAVDLWTKKVVFELLEVETITANDGPVILSQKVYELIPGFFELEATYNRGAFHGWFSEHTGVLTLLSALAIVVIGGILFYSIRQKTAPSLWFVAALGLISSGTLGNLYDRWTVGAVRDWIKWFVVWDGEEKVWPNFNIADSCICIGVGLLILLEVRNALRERRKKKAAAAS